MLLETSVMIITLFTLLSSLWQESVTKYSNLEGILGIC